MQNTITLSLPATKTLKFSLTLKFFWLLAAAALFSLFIVCVFQLNFYTRNSTSSGTRKAGFSN